MVNIGERLEEARKRKELSIREAAEATKIRGDFLIAFENNQFGDITLPEIYKRGFLKNYSVFLSLDYEKMLADYTAHQLGNSRLARKEGREFFGRMDMPNSGGRRQAAEPTEPIATGSHEEVGPVSVQTTASETETEPIARPTRDSRISGGKEAASLLTGDKTLYWKIGLVAGSAFILFLLIFALIKAITSGGGGDAPPRINDTPPQTGSGTTPTPEAQPGNLTQVILVGTGETFVQVKQIENGEILYKGTLSSGERVPLQIRGAADIAFTNGQNLRIIKDGEAFEPNTERSLIGKINTDNL